MGCECKENSDVLEYIQGDTFYRQVSVVNSDGDEIDPTYISKVEFLLLTVDKAVEETDELNYDSDIGKWVVNVDTSDWKATTYVMRYRITYTDGQILTPYEKTLQIKK